MSTLEEIKSKYQLDAGSVSVTVDFESMRAGAKNTLSEVESFARDMKRESAGGLKSDNEWMSRRKSRIANDINEQKRKLSMVQNYIDEVKGMLDKAESNLSKVK